MTRAEMLARMGSQELTAWMALLLVKADEAKYRRDMTESGDGNVIVYGANDQDDEEEELQPDGETV